MTTFLQIGPYGPGCDEKSPFPDGQPHITLSADPAAFIEDGDGVTFTARITSAIDLLNIGAAVDVARHLNPGIKIDLVLLYVWGRMDRRISDREPYTLRVICDFINSMNLQSVSVFCPHSQATSDLLRNYRQFSQNVEDKFFNHGVFNSIPFGSPATWVDNLSLVFPDAGAAKRFAKSSLLSRYQNASIVTLHKERSERTGEIKGMKVIQGDVKDNCVIIDDLCDGGATFKGASAALRDLGAKRVSLVVPHGIFSKGTTIPTIDYIYTSNSFKEWEPHDGFGVFKF